MPSFSIPLSGLQADSTALNTIANNLSNMNTTAYKSQSVNFSDLFYQQVGTAGSGNPLQVGGGTQVSSISTNFAASSPNSTGSASNVALEGEGFFVVQGANSGAPVYTRNGTFGETATGSLVTQDGLQVMGYPAKAGIVDTTSGLVPLVIPKGQVLSPQPTTNISLTGNLDAIATAPTTSVISTGTLSTSAAATDLTKNFKVVDSTGAVQDGTIVYTPGAGGAWTYTATVGGVSQGPFNLTPAPVGTSFADSNAGKALSFTGLGDGGNASFTLNNSGLSNSSVVAGAVGSANGTATVTSTGTLSTTGGTAFADTISVTDSLGASQTGTIAYTPVAAGAWNYTATLGGKAMTGTLTPIGGVGFTDSNAGPLSFSGMTGGGNASVTLNTAGLTQQSVPPISSVADGSSIKPTEPVIVFDSLGNPQVATINFTKSPSAPGSWTYSITIPGTTAGANTTGTLAFDSAGKLLAGTSNITGITFSGLADGAAPIKFNWNILSANGSSTLSQTASASSFSTALADGYKSGVLSTYAINSNGVVEGTYDNGQTSALGQLAVAVVTNQQGLSKLGSSNYATTLASGQATVGVAGTGGRGTMRGSYVEASNVDISTEFSNLIVAQRAFEANSKAVTTFDTVAQTTINMIR